MPAGLKWLTVLSGGLVLFVAWSLVPGGSIQVGIRRMPNEEWWRTGAGPAIAVPAVVLGVAAVLMLKRVRQARVLSVVGWVLMTAAMPLVAAVVDADIASSAPQVILGLAFSGGVALYLFRGGAAGRYFDPP